MPLLDGVASCLFPNPALPVAHATLALRMRWFLYESPPPLPSQRASHRFKVFCAPYPEAPLSVSPGQLWFAEVARTGTPSPPPAWNGSTTYVFSFLPIRVATYAQRTYLLVLGWGCGR